MTRVIKENITYITSKNKMTKNRKLRGLKLYKLKQSEITNEEKRISIQFFLEQTLKTFTR